MTNNPEWDNPDYADGMPSFGKTLAVSAAGCLAGIGIFVAANLIAVKLKARKDKKNQK